MGKKLSALNGRHAAFAVGRNFFRKSDLFRLAAAGLAPYPGSLGCFKRRIGFSIPLSLFWRCFYYRVNFSFCQRVFRDYTALFPQFSGFAKFLFLFIHIPCKKCYNCRRMFLVVTKGEPMRRHILHRTVSVFLLICLLLSFTACTKLRAKRLEFTPYYSEHIASAYEQTSPTLLMSEPVPMDFD